MSRSEHLAWCKERAIKCAEQNDLQGAFTSFQSDMTKHDETRGHETLKLFSQLFYGGHLSSPAKIKSFIEGFG